MRLIPEYEPVDRLCLSFRHSFFNTRFHYGRAHCEIIRAVGEMIDIEIWVDPEDLPYWEDEVRRHLPGGGKVMVCSDSPKRGCVAEYVPIFAEDEAGQTVGLVFPQPVFEEAEEYKAFALRWMGRLSIPPVELGFGFTTTAVGVNEELILLSEEWFSGEGGAERLARFAALCPQQTLCVVPTLAQDVTHDIDMFLWPIKPKVWIASEYPAGSPQAQSVEPSVRLLAEHGHTVHRVPGLERIAYDDVDTMPNYANGVLLNNTVLVPAYARREDGAVVGILKDYGFDVFPIDCRDVILSNSGVHCISKTVPVRKTA